MMDPGKIDFGSYAALAEHTGAVAWKYDCLSQKLVSVSGSARRILGHSPAALRKGEPDLLREVFQKDASFLDSLRALSPGEQKVVKHLHSDDRQMVSLVFCSSAPENGFLIGVTQRCADFSRALSGSSKKGVSKAGQFFMELLCSLEGAELNQWSVIKEVQEKFVADLNAEQSDVWLPDLRDGYLRTERSCRLRMPGRFSISSDSDPLELKKGQGLAGKAWKTMKPSIESNLSTRTRLRRFKEFDTRGINTALELPLRFDSGLTVVLEILGTSTREFLVWSLEELLWLTEVLAAFISLLPISGYRYNFNEEARELIDATPMMIWLKDSQGKVLAVNSEVERKLSLPYQYLVGRNTVDIHRGFGDRYRKGDWKVLSSGEATRGFIEKYVAPGGESFWIRVDKVPLGYSGKNPVGEADRIAVFCSDLIPVDEESKNEQSLQAEMQEQFLYQSEELAETNIFFDLSREKLCIADKNGYFRRVNPAWSDSLGYTQEELLAQPYLSFVHPDDRADTINIADELESTGRIKDFENRYIGKDGKVRWFRWSATAFDDVVYGVAYDITDKKLAEQQLESLNERYSRIAALVPGVIYQFLYKPDGSMSFPYISEGCKDLFGYDFEAIQENGQLIFDSLHPDDLPVVMRLIDESVSDVSGFRCETRVVRENGRITHVQASSSPTVQDDGSLLYYGLMMDITDLKEAQEKNESLTLDLAGRIESLERANKELENMTGKLELAYDQALEVSKLKSEFVANISHEIRTPISAVIGLSELLLDSELDPDQKDHADSIMKSAKTLLTIINDILDFSKIEAGRLQIEKIEFDLVALVEGGAALFAHEASIKGLQLSVWIDPRLPATFAGDPVRCRQIMLNLLSNAIKFTDRGEISLRAYPEFDQDGDTNLVIEVEDDGIGISKAALGKLFSPFVQADGSTTRQFGGTGLGLSISKRLAELLGGSISLDTREGEGSTFRFNYPCELALVEKQSPETHPKRKVLLFSVSEQEKFILHSYLEYEGYEVLDATGYGDLIYKLDDYASEASCKDYPVVVISLTGDKIGNIGVVEKLRHGRRYQNVSILCLYDYRNRAVSTRALEVGANGCLMIPLKKAELLSLVSGERKGNELSYHRERSRTSPDTLLDSPRVLVVEDNVLMRKLAKKQLENLNVTVELRKNGLEALDAVKNKTFDLVLMDCQMPELDGYEATLEIRKWESQIGGHVPIVAMTAFAMEGDRENCLAAGMDDYLKKPVSLDDLQAVIAKWLPEREPEREGALVYQEVMNRSDTHGAADIFDEELVDFELIKQHYGSDVTDILESFCDEVLRFLPRLEAAIENQEWKALAADAHQFKGLVSVLCLENLEQTMNDFQNQAKSGHDAEVKVTFLKLKTHISSVVKYINRALESEKL